MVETNLNLPNRHPTSGIRRDLHAAFVAADVDKSGGIDKDEFLALFAKVRKGEIEGVGKRSFSLFGRRS